MPEGKIDTVMMEFYSKRPSTGFTGNQESLYQESFPLTTVETQEMKDDKIIISKFLIL